MSAWAWDEHGQPLKDWLLGDLRRDNMRDLLASPRAQRLRARLDENFGHCKIFAYVFSPEWTVDSLFRKADPLYQAADAATGARGASTPSTTAVERASPVAV